MHLEGITMNLENIVGNGQKGLGGYRDLRRARGKDLMKKRFLAYLVFALLTVVAVTGCGFTAYQANQVEKVGVMQAEKMPPENPNVILATTTSTVDSGLLDVLVPDFEKQTGYKVKVIAVGTGAALTMGERGDADVLLVHSPAAEKKLVENKAVVNYQLVMHNDFVIVGPSADPAKIQEQKSAAEGFKVIAAAKAIFVSRGDDSGTHKMEKSLWQKAGIDPEGKWYQESGSGMGQTLTITSEKQGYTLTDRATYLNMQKSLDLQILLEGDPAFLNIYHVMEVNPEKFPKVNQIGAEAFIDFLVSPETQKLIGDYGKDKFGQSLFYPDAGKSDQDLGL